MPDKVEVPDVKALISDGLKSMKDEVVTEITAKIEEKAAKAPPVIVMGATEDEKIVDGAIFKGLGHFMVDVRNSRNRLTPALDRYATSYKAISGMGVSVDSDGGFIAPATLSNTIMEKSLEGSFLQRCFTLPCVGPILRLPAVVDNTRSGATTMFGGITCSYVPEGGAYPAAGKVQTEMIEFKPIKLVAKAAITEELLEDNAISAEALVNKCVPEAIRYVRERKVLWGTGAGEPLGAFGLYDGTNTRCAAAITRSGANAIAAVDVFGLVARAYGSMDKYLFMANKPATYAVIRQLPLSQPGPQGSSISQGWVQTLDGVPVQWSEHMANDIGTRGDIVLADWSQYVLVTKGGVRSKISLELRFDYGENVYVFIIREDGAPWWRSALTGVDGLTRSPFCWLTTA